MHNNHTMNIISLIPVKHKSWCRLLQIHVIGFTKIPGISYGLIISNSILLVPTRTPYTLEFLLPEVRTVAPKWMDLGQALSLDEGYLDEIFTNFERDEDCLQEMLSFYMNVSFSRHNWEEMVAALRDIGCHEEAEKIYELHVKPCKWNNSTVYNVYMYMYMYMC